MSQANHTLDIPTFPLHGSRLIEASAGTGKTFTIALLYARLILQHGGNNAFARPLTPPDILVITFTEAATEELKDRIRQRLVEAAECFLADSASVDTRTRPADPLLALRHDYDPTDWPRCARLLQVAADWMDEAAISTIHGWCYRMLREHAFDTGSLFSQSLLHNEADLLQSVVEDYWRIHFYPRSPTLAGLITETLAEPAALARRLRGLLGASQPPLLFDGKPVQAPADLGDLFAALEDWTLKQKQLEEKARQQWQQDADHLEELLQAWQPNLLKNTYDPSKGPSFAERLAHLRTWADGGPRPAGFAHFAAGSFKVKKAQAGTEPEHKAFGAIARLIEHEERKPGQESGSNLDTLLLAHARDWVAERLHLTLQRRAEIGFNDMLRLLDDALQQDETGALARRLRHRYPVALVDEFQDTDPLQYRILDTIYEPKASAPDRTLIMIGDPKQAIYSFRGADIRTYLDARSATSGRHYTLGRNFRSSRSMVDAVNRLFKNGEEWAQGAFRYRSGEKNPLPFQPVDAQGTQEQLQLQGQTVTPLNIWLQPPDSENDKNGVQWLSRNGYQRQMAESTASTLVQWLNDEHSGFDSPEGWRRLRPADVAILVRSGTEAEAVRQALSRRQLPSVYLSDRASVFETQEAIDLLHWLQACAEPGDERLLRTALATDSLNWSLSELDRLNQDELLREAQSQRFRDYARRWRTQGVLSMVHRLLHDHDLPARLLQRDNGERRLTNLLHLAEWLQQASAQVDGEQSLLRLFSEQIQVPQSAGDEQILRLESDADLIKVVTIHKSKGLEYPLVMLPFASSWRMVDGKTPMVSVPWKGGMALEIAGNKIAPGAWQQADDERLKEDLRLLYVALTRARHAVWMGVGALNRGSTKSSKLHESALGYLLGGGDELDPAALDQALEKLSDATISVTSPPEPENTVWQPDALMPWQPARKVLRARLEPWWVASYSALSAELGSPGLLNSEGVEPLQPAEPEIALDELQREEWQAIAGTESASGNEAPAEMTGLHRFPRGPEPGTFLHNLLEWAARHRLTNPKGTLHGFAAARQDDAGRRTFIEQRCRLRGWEAWTDTLDKWLVALLERPWDSLDAVPTPRLIDIREQQPELEFWLSARHVSAAQIDRLVSSALMPERSRPRLGEQQLNGLLKGFVDLVFNWQGRYYVADWKSNWLGPDASAYSTDAMTTAVMSKRYDLQAVLYTLALHRLLRVRLPDYDPEQHLGGAVYLFLRGVEAPTGGLWTCRPPAALLDQLDTLFRGDSDAPQEDRP
ncbi:MAG: exodeoxyribonuclease V subunit beta [Natronospirillum sp.]|uniref:exodeoxyribonuclease V subunit beta n=1 Tax=Natronospirillum sp. TaxID=2812955 RepID=UPI0025EF681E|nr:exodeoxyribonuclease V subunit beta [Natronospirillum sp.]MCH8552659.1 exodeoxyribonuclease V subunit beta [Natronospirillum sp.]